MERINYDVDTIYINNVFENLQNVAKREMIAFEIHTGSKCLYYYANPVLSRDKQSWIERKRNSVIWFEQDTLSLCEKNNGNQQQFIEKYGLDNAQYTLTPGSIPVFNQGNLSLIVTITGLTPQEDHELALEAIKKAMEV